jgi:hypothetical protein
VRAARNLAPEPRAQIRKRRKTENPAGSPVRTPDKRGAAHYRSCRRTAGPNRPAPRRPGSGLRPTRLGLTPIQRAGPESTGAEVFVHHQRPNVVVQHARVFHSMPPLPPLLAMTVRIDPRGLCVADLERKPHRASDERHWGQPCDREALGPAPRIGGGGWRRSRVWQRPNSAPTADRNSVGGGRQTAPPTSTPARAGAGPRARGLGGPRTSAGHRIGRASMPGRARP